MSDHQDLIDHLNNLGDEISLAIKKWQPLVKRGQLLTDKERVEREIIPFIKKHYDLEVMEETLGFNHYFIVDVCVYESFRHDDDHEANILQKKCEDHVTTWLEESQNDELLDDYDFHKFDEHYVARFVFEAEDKELLKEHNLAKKFKDMRTFYKEIEEKKWWIS